jgi:hypothetical protein
VGYFEGCVTSEQEDWEAARLWVETQRVYKKKCWVLGDIHKGKAITIRKNLRTPTTDNTQEQDEETNDVARMSPPEIRAKLKHMGFPTKVCNVKRLHELYLLAIQSVSER